MSHQSRRADLAYVAARRAKLVAYRRQKRPYGEIYEELGYGSEKAATRDFSRALQESIAARDTEVEIYREEQLVELEYLAEEIHKIFRADYFHVSTSGRIAVHPDTGEPLLDKGPNLAAADRLLKINAQVAKLRGIDQTIKIEGAFTIDALNQAITDAQQQLAAFGSETGETAEAEAAED
jgi:hypothetical protein